MKGIKVLALPVVAGSGEDVNKLVEESVDVKRAFDSYLESGYKIEATHTIVLGKVGYLVYSLVKEV